MAVLLATCAGTAMHVRRLALLPATPQPLQISRAFVDLFISRALVYVGFYTLLGYLYFYVARTMSGDAKTMTGIVLMVFLAAGAIGAASVREIDRLAGAAAAAVPANRMDRRAIASFGGAGFILALVAFLVAHATSAVLASALIAGAAWGVFLTADWALGCRFLPRNALATAMGVWNLALLVPQIVAPLIATAVLSSMHALQSSSGPRVAFVIAVVEVAAGIAWIWRLPASSA